MDADIPDDFGARLKLTLKIISLSPAALASAVGVDKSVVSRWLSGKVVPSGHNLSRVSTEIARRRPGFSTLSFEAPAEDFRVAIGLTAPAANQQRAPDPNMLPIPYELIDDSRHEVARRGDEYFGHYDLYYWSFTQPGRIVRMAVMLRPALGLIEARYGAKGFEFRGWALLLLNRLYFQLAELRHEAMLFMVTNAGQQPNAALISGIILGPCDGTLQPTASPTLLRRVADISGDMAGDDAEFERRSGRDPFSPADLVPASVGSLLVRLRAGAGPLENGWFRVPYVDADDTG